MEKKAEMVFDPSKQLDVNFDENQFNLNGMNSEKQKQLIQKAFALGGEELEGFEKEKEKEIEASLPKAVNDNKYGWVNISSVLHFILTQGAKIAPLTNVKGYFFLQLGNSIFFWTESWFTYSTACLLLIKTIQ